jgi:hypothetical protein
LLAWRFPEVVNDEDHLLEHSSLIPAEILGQVPTPSLYSLGMNVGGGRKQHVDAA